MLIHQAACRILTLVQLLGPTLVLASIDIYIYILLSHTLWGLKRRALQY